MVGINIQYVRSQVIRVIQSAPTWVRNERQDWVTDGHGGRKKDGDPYLVGEGFNALFHNAGSPKIQILVSMGGRQEQESSLKLYIAYDDDIDVAIDDTWLHNGVEYRFANVTNILELDVMYEVELEIKED